MVKNLKQFRKDAEDWLEKSNQGGSRKWLI